MATVKHSGLLALTFFSRRLAAKSTDAATALFQCARQFHEHVHLPVVSAEAAGEAARRSVPLLELPAALEFELEEFLADRGVKPKDARQLGHELRERLKSLSHTPQRGGLGASATTPARGGRLRGAELMAAREAFEAGQLLSMDDRAVNAALGLPPPLRIDERHAPQMHKLAPKYKTESEVVAYIVSRMAPEYAVCRRVLDEAVRLLAATEMLPGDAAVKWRPREALVYGAGVGASVVASLESCSSPTLTRLVALEPSSRRQALGSRVEQAYRTRQRQIHEQQHQHKKEKGRHGDALQERRDEAPRTQQVPGPLVSWVQALPPLSKAATDQRRRYDLVVAPYQLTVLPTAEERQRLVRELWDRCGDVLVLVEPGTPRGFAAMAEARELLLSLESRKRKQLELAAATASGGQSEAGGLSGADPRVVNKLRSAGAHVVAPCPHDGACPMQGRKRTWCHFSQPLLLPFFMQHAMVPPGDKAQGRGRALNVQNERFSYLVLRRGPRPSFRSAVARDFEDGGGKDFVAASFSASAAVPARLPPRVVLSQVMLNRTAAADVSTSPGVLEIPPVVGGGQRSPVSGRTASGGHCSDTSATPRRAPLFGAPDSADGSTPADDLRSAGREIASTVAAPSRSNPVSTKLSGGQEIDDGTEPSLSDSGHGSAAPVTPISAFARKYPAFGPGLVGRLAALQEAGIDWAGAGGNDEADSSNDLRASNTELGPLRAMRWAAKQAELPGLPPAGSRTAAYGPDGGVSGTHQDLDAFGGVHSGTADRRQAGSTPTGHATGVASDATAGSEGTATENGPVLPILSAPRLQSGEEEEAASPNPFNAAEFEWAQGALQLSLDDVSDDEYDRAELQLMERIYGAEAAVTWLNSRQGAGPAAADDSEAVLASDDESADASENDTQQEHDDGRADRDAGPGCESGPASREVLRLAEASSYGWGRLVRPPRLRGGHVILDMCVGAQHHYPDNLGERPDSAAERPSKVPAAAGAGGTAAVPTDTTSPDGVGSPGAAYAEDDQGGAVSNSEPLQQAALGGRLVQQVVAKSARRGWMGAPAYRLARKLSWGDCWPDWYIRGHNARETVTGPLQSAPEVEPRLGGRK